MRYIGGELFHGNCCELSPFVITCMTCRMGRVLRPWIVVQHCVQVTDRCRSGELWCCTGVYRLSSRLPREDT